MDSSERRGCCSVCWACLARMGLSYSHFVSLAGVVLTSSENHLFHTADCQSRSYNAILILITKFDLACRTIPELCDPQRSVNHLGFQCSCLTVIDVNSVLVLYIIITIIIIIKVIIVRLITKLKLIMITIISGLYRQLQYFSSNIFKVWIEIF